MATVIRQPHVYRERIIEEPASYQHAGSSSAYAVSSIIYYILDVVEVLLAVRLLFRLFAASTSSPFVSFIYSITSPLTTPFQGIFRNTTFAGGMVEWATIIAMIAFAILAYAIVELIYRFSKV